MRRDTRACPERTGLKPFLWTCAALCILFFALFGTSTQVFHEKRTLTVSTPTGPVSASATTTVTRTNAYGIVYGMFKGLTGGATGSTMAQGTALMLEVTPRHWLFVINSDAWGNHAYSGLSQGPIVDPASPRPPRGTPPETVASYLRRSLPGTEVFPQRKRWPAFVTFDDPADPKTIRLVDPDNLAASFGAGVSAQSFTLSAAEKPSDPAALIRLMPWLCAAERFPTFGETDHWTDLDRRLFALRQAANFVPSYCGPR